MSNEEIIKMMDMIQWAEKKHKTNNGKHGVTFSFCNSKRDKRNMPRLKITFGERCGEVQAAKYARYSSIITNDGEIPGVMFFDFSAEKESGPQWFKICEGHYIAPAMDVDEIEAFNEVWSPGKDYKLEYNREINKYFITAEEVY